MVEGLRSKDFHGKGGYDRHTFMGLWLGKLE
jgi:hypothetical protein